MERGRGAVFSSESRLFVEGLLDLQKTNFSRNKKIFVSRRVSV